MKNVKFHKTLLLYVLATFSFMACKKDAPIEELNNLPSDVEVTIIVNYFSAFVSWTPASDEDDDQLTYDVYLQNSMIADELSDTNYLVDNLEVNFPYTGKVVVRDGNGGTSETEFSFATGTATKTIGGSGSDFGRIIMEVENGNYLIASNSTSNDGFVGLNNGSYDIVISKHDPYGNMLWSSVLGSSLNDSVLDIITTIDNGYLVVGRSGRLFKIDNEGSTTWRTILREDPSNSESNEFDINSAIEVSDGYIFAGSESGQSAVLMKTDRGGNYLWDRRFDGSGTDIFRDMILLNDGNLMVVGETGSNDGDFPNNHGQVDMIVGKFNTNGDAIFIRNVGGTDYDRAYQIQESNGRIYIGGESWSNDVDFSNNNGLIDSFIGEIDSEGNVIWLKNYGTAVFNSFRTFFVNDTDIYLSLDDSLDNAWVLKLDQAGNQIDEIIFGGSGDDAVSSMVNYANGTMALIGHSNSTDIEGQTNLGEYDILFYKF